MERLTPEREAAIDQLLARIKKKRDEHHGGQNFQPYGGPFASDIANLERTVEMLRGELNAVRKEMVEYKRLYPDGWTYAREMDQARQAAERRAREAEGKLEQIERQERSKRHDWT